MPIKDISGTKFGRLTAMEFSYRTASRASVWKFRCDCGTVVERRVSNVASGTTASCGCLKSEQIRSRFDYLIGRKFERLTVVCKADTVKIGRMKKPAQRWECECDCGGRISVTTNALLTGNTKSCGCLVGDMAKLRVSGNDQKLLAEARTMKHRADRREIPWLLLFEDAAALMGGACKYCGSLPKEAANARRSHKTVRNGIDRLDSSKGYEKTNCVSCCSWCNIAKNALSVDAFLAHVEKIYEHSIKGKANGR